MKSRYTEAQMVAMLREADAASVAEVAKKHGVSQTTLYAWKKRFGRMDVDEAKRLKELATENTRLRKLLADRDLEIEVMKEIAAKKGERVRSSGAGGLRAQARRPSAPSLLAAECGTLQFAVQPEEGGR